MSGPQHKATRRPATPKAGGTASGELANSGESRQNGAPKPGLSIAQRNAIDALVGGKRDREVAELVGVSRSTVQGWRTAHPEFMAELNRVRAEVWGAGLERFRHLVPKAIQVVEAELDGEDCLAAALAVLRLARMGEALSKHPIGPDTAEAIVEERARARHFDPAQALLDEIHGPNEDDFDAVRAEFDSEYRRLVHAADEGSAQ
jgi:hypothetical protein